MIKKFFTRLFNKLFGRPEKKAPLPANADPKPQNHPGEE